METEIRRLRAMLARREGGRGRRFAPELRRRITAVGRGLRVEGRSWSKSDAATSCKPTICSSGPVSFLPSDPGIAPGGPHSGHAEPEPGVDGAAVANATIELGAEVSDSRPRREVRSHIRPRCGGAGTRVIKTAVRTPNMNPERTAGCLLFRPMDGGHDGSPTLGVEGAVDWRWILVYKAHKSRRSGVRLVPDETA
jgi:hypothetical protein